MIDLIQIAWLCFMGIIGFIIGMNIGNISMWIAKKLKNIMEERAKWINKQ